MTSGFQADRDRGARGPAVPVSPPPARWLALGALALATMLALGACGPAGTRSPAGTGSPAAAPAPAGDEQTTPGQPTGIAIPAIGVDAAVVPVGLRDDGAMEVPPPDRTGWYRLGPVPGAAGPAVIVGHVDSRGGPAVFHKLTQLRPGDEIVVRADATERTFVVERSEWHPKDELPVERIWPRTEEPLLRLVTCGRRYDRAARSYLDNLVVFASAVDG